MKKGVMYYGVIIIASLLLMSGECDKDKVEDCGACTSAQEHYFEKLQLYGCDSDVPADARTQVVIDCDGAKQDKAVYLEIVCGESGTPIINCD